MLKFGSVENRNFIFRLLKLKKHDTLLASTIVLVYSYKTILIGEIGIIVREKHSTAHQLQRKDIFELSKCVNELLFQ